MALGYNASVDASNKVVIGNSLVTTIGGYANWSNYSDARVKENVADSTLGLEFIERLRPVKFNYIGQEVVHDGFIAQEVEQACAETGTEFGGLRKPESPDGKYMLSYSEFVVPLVNAVKELKAENEELKRRNQTMEADLEAVKAKLGL
jgi:hypothetical protein